MSRTPQQALKDAIESGAVQAWMDGKSIQYLFKENSEWTNGSCTYADFADPDYQWRPKPEPPPEPPVVKWINIKDKKPEKVEEYLVCGFFSSYSKMTVITALWNTFNKKFVGFPEALYWSPMPNLP